MHHGESNHQPDMLKTGIIISELRWVDVRERTRRVGLIWRRCAVAAVSGKAAAGDGGDGLITLVEIHGTMVN